MLKTLAATLLMVSSPVHVSAETLLVDIGHDGHADKVVVAEQGHAGSVSVYDDAKLVGKFDNLIVDEPALSSDVVTLAGGGMAIEIDSDGSRNKYHVLAPISRIDGRLYVECVYKSVYDSVDETRSVGTSCGKVELSKFDVSAAVNDEGLKTYGTNYTWLKRVPSPSCVNPVGLEYDNYRVARCAVAGVSDTRKQKIVVFDKQDKALLSVVGYEIIPGRDGASFMLTTDLPRQTAVLKGNLTCFVSDASTTSEISGKAKLASRLGITYTLASTNGCLSGQYSYAGKDEKIALKGSNIDGLAYLLELNANHESSGMFVLDRLSAGIHGIWIGVPPKAPLTVE